MVIFIGLAIYQESNIIIKFLFDKIWSLNGDMGYMLILTQIVAIIVDAFIAFSKKKQNVYLAFLIGNSAHGLVELVNKNWCGVITYIIIVIRSIAVLKKDKIGTSHHSIPISICLAHFIFGIITYDSIQDGLAIIASCIMALVLWYSNDLQKYRLANILTDVIWSFVNVMNGTPFLLIGRFINSSMQAIAYFIYGKDTKQKLKSINK